MKTNALTSLSKIAATGFAFLALAGAAFAADRTELDARIQKLTMKFENMQQKLDKRIAPDYLQKAQGIILLDRTKAGFILGFEGGSGLAMVKDPETQQWGAAAFVGAAEGSIGFQIGGQQSFVVVLLMSTNATQALTDSTFDFGGEAAGTVGRSSTKAEATASSTEEPVLVFTDRKGIYGGATIKGGAISPDDKANLYYYAEPYTMREILFQRKVEPSTAAVELANKLDAWSVEEPKQAAVE